MITAKERARDALISVDEPTGIRDRYLFSRSALEEYADQICKEQREICLDRWMKAGDDPLGEHLAIHDAPKPKAL